MTQLPPHLNAGPDSLPRMPHWIRSHPQKRVGNPAFSSGAALAVLDMAIRHPSGSVPTSLLRDRLAMKAAMACLKLEGRHESEADIRDAICLTRPGDSAGPAGEMFSRWRKLARVEPGVKGWVARLGGVVPEGLAKELDIESVTGAGADGPVERAAAVLENLLTGHRRDEAAALMLADLALARALGWSAPVPILADNLGRKSIREIASGETRAEEAVCHALVAGSAQALRLATDLARRTDHLRRISPKLRSKVAGEALGVFLTHDAVSPSGMLSPVIRGTKIGMTGRTARRLCDRLVDLGAVRELTGRTTFRLYGI